MAFEGLQSKINVCLRTSCNFCSVY